MFSRIRYAAKVLSYSSPKVSRFDDPDITFEEDSPQEVTKISAGIGTFIEIVLISLFIGFTVGRGLHRLFPAKEAPSLLTLTGIGAAILSIFLAALSMT